MIECAMDFVVPVRLLVCLVTVRSSACHERTLHMVLDAEGNQARANVVELEMEVQHLHNFSINRKASYSQHNAAAVHCVGCHFLIVYTCAYVVSFPDQGNAVYNLRTRLNSFVGMIKTCRYRGKVS